MAQFCQSLSTAEQPICIVVLAALGEEVRNGPWVDATLTDIVWAGSVAGDGAGVRVLPLVLSLQRDGAGDFVEHYDAFEEATATVYNLQCPQPGVHMAGAAVVRGDQAIRVVYGPVPAGESDLVWELVIELPSVRVCCDLAAAFFASALRALLHARLALLRPPRAMCSDSSFCRTPSPMMDHQARVVQLLKPGGQIHRLLIDHPTGAGKTRTMIGVLDSFYLVPLAKLVIFTRPGICRNFYAELLRWPNRYRDYFGCSCPAEANRACGVPDWKRVRRLEWDICRLPEAEVRQLCASIKEALSMKGAIFKGELRPAPTEAFKALHFRAKLWRSVLRHFAARSPGA